MILNDKSSRFWAFLENLSFRALKLVILFAKPQTFMSWKSLITVTISISKLSLKKLQKRIYIFFDWQFWNFLFSLIFVSIIIFSHY